MIRPFFPHLPPVHDNVFFLHCDDATLSDNHVKCNLAIFPTLATSSQHFFALGSVAFDSLIVGDIVM